MPADPNARQSLLQKVVAYAAAAGIADKSLREIAAGIGSSHRMLLYHFGSREGLMAAIVGVIEAQQRSAMAIVPAGVTTVAEPMLHQWRQLTSSEVRPFVRLFFEVFGQAIHGVAGTQALLENLTGPWLEDGVAAARQLGYDLDDPAVRLGVAVTRGLLLDLLAGATTTQVTASYQLFVDLFAAWAEENRVSP